MVISGIGLKNLFVVISGCVQCKMEWLMMNAHGANTFGENLGYYLADSYIVAEECEGV